MKGLDKFAARYMRNKNIFSKSTTFLLIILLAMSVLVYHTAQSYVQVVTVAKTKTTGAADKDAPEQHETFNVSHDVILSASSIHLDQEFYQIKEIVFGDEENVEVVPYITEHFTSYFRTLFRQVISPNAP